MSYKSMIEKTQHPNTVNTMLKDMNTLCFVEGDILIVHSSMSALGYVCGGASAVVEALLKAVGASGTIVMPSFTLENSDPAAWGDYPVVEPACNHSNTGRGRLFPPPVPKEWHDIFRENIPAYDKAITVCSKGLGIIAECFRTYPGTLRSDHPSASFTANGLHGQQIIEKHPLSPCFGLVSPLGVLYRLGAKILLLGTNYDRCTSFHLSEDITDMFPKITHGSAIMEDGARIWKWYENYDYPADSFILLGEACEKEGFVYIGKVGCADCKLLDMKTAVDFGVDWITTNWIK